MLGADSSKVKLSLFPWSALFRYGFLDFSVTTLGTGLVPYLGTYRASTELSALPAIIVTSFSK